MTPVGKWLRDRLERWLQRYHEGPEMPQRIADMAIAFAQLYPTATRAQWLAFSAELARESYRSGYVRGFEYVERDPELWMPKVPPEELADQIDPDWRWRPIDMDRGIEEPEGVPREEADEVEETIRMIKETARAAWARMRTRGTS